MIVYASRTGNVEYIIQQLRLPSDKIVPNLKMTEPFLLFTYTDLLGEVPSIVGEFMKHNHSLCKGVIASGNSNFGNANFCGSADKLNKRYGIPIVRKIELRGFSHDYDAVKAYYQKWKEGSSDEAVLETQ